MKPILYRYRNSESVIKAMEGYTPGEGWEPLYDQAAMDAAVAAEQERCAKVCEAIQPTSAWHDAPTCDGLWVCNEGDDNPYRWTTHSVKFPISPLLVGEDERWFGPIPQDAKAEEKNHERP